MQLPPPDKPVPIVQLPEEWNVSQIVADDGKPRILVVVNGPYGQLRHVLDPEPAKTVGAMLVKLGEAGPLLLGGNGVRP